MSDKEKTYEHPSYVTVSFNRCHGGRGEFFGSSVRTDSFIRLEVKQAELVRNLSNDWIHSSKLLCEVDMTPAQFAELISSLNTGPGVPGTLRHINQADIPVGRVPDPPFISKIEQFKEEIAEVPQDIYAYMDGLESQVKELGLSGKKTEGLLRSIDTLRMKIRENMPFVVNSAYEALEKSVVEAKSVVDNWYTHLLVRLGIKSLQENQAKVELLESSGDFKNKDK